MRLHAFALLALAGLLLSGCSGPGAESTLGQSALVRHVVATFDEASAAKASAAGSVEGAIASFTTVWYEYTHQGDDASPKDLTFHYTLATGTPGTVPLSKFTSKSTLRDGDRIKIQPDPAAGMFGVTKVVDAAGETLVARSGEAAQWFTVANYPIPIAATQAGTTSWTMTGHGSVDAQVRDMELPETTSFECDEYDCYEVSEPSGYVHYAKFDVAMDLDSTMSVQAGKDAVKLESTLGVDYDIDIAVDAETPDATIDGTIQGDVRVDATGRLELAFNAKREIREVAYGGDIKVEGDLDVQGFPGAEPPPANPWLEESLPRTAHPQNLGSTPAEKVLYDFLMAAYAMDLAQGDEIRFVARGPIEDSGKSIEIRYVSQVLAVEDRTVGGSQRPAFKVADTLGFQFLDGATVLKEQKVELTYWVDLVSSLPVFAQSKVQQTLSGTDLTDSFGFMRSIDPEAQIPDIPADARVVFTAEGTQKMTAYGGDFKVAPLLGVGASRMIPVLGAIGMLNR